ncbi:GTP cyclohydrolase I [Halodesulfurarchaeum formicicum]|uniref:GTP cyclohydrolase MptA n=1 Tax=Halodesulfurarchaeum formicicum TaxID=1873524 RepID=A0A1D8S6N1_9EURY|nr:GTP cyclohydrolase MptA [Halodesulfurarchaeum formicicum]AOW80988.1 GTP cyclohydrolase I [Halodesulfurarchaeum formicicum]APE96324.1 GTP cyclohydrolase IV [Halodesulfurarchaeum formicicum]
MSHDLPDVQATEPDVTVGLERVGVTGVEKLVEINRGSGRPLVLMAEFEVYVDLPRKRKGLDMSRNLEVIDETLEDAVSEPVYQVEEMCGEVAERLLQKHEYTTKAMVQMEAEYMIRDETPASGRTTQSRVDFIASATASEDSETREEIGARVDGMTVCPCSQGMIEERAREELEDLGVGEEEVTEFLSRVPQAGHSQRGHATLTVESPGKPDVDFRDLVEIARDAMSARIYNMAKRPDEDHMTYAAHANARFVEDCVRSMAEQVVEECDEIDDEAVITMKQENEESIHQHNAHAERIATMDELRAEVTGE